MLVPPFNQSFSLSTNYVIVGWSLNALAGKYSHIWLAKSFDETLYTIINGEWNFFWSIYGATSMPSHLTKPVVGRKFAWCGGHTLGL